MSHDSDRLGDNSSSSSRAENPTEEYTPPIDLTQLKLSALDPSHRTGWSTVDDTKATSAAQDFDSAVPGKVLGDFELIREIGRGGMGVVYEAVQLSLNKPVALKILPGSSMLDPRAVKRFQNEAWATAELQHRNIVPVHQIGNERGVHFFAMQLIRGIDLAEFCQNLRRLADQTTDVEESFSNLDSFLSPRKSSTSRSESAEQESASTASRPTATRPTASRSRKDSTHASSGSARDTLASRELLKSFNRSRGTSTPRYLTALANVGIQVADALQYAHEMGIIHRDIKPSNLLLDHDGDVWVSDFGLAHIESNATLTATNAMVGTLRYMSPEQVLGKKVGIDHRTDVYSLGVTLYELLTLQPAFSGGSREELIRRITFDEPIAPRRIDRGVPQELETIILKAISKNPQDRYQDAAELSADLRRFRDDEPIKGRKPTMQRRLLRWSQRHRSMVASLAALVLITFIASVAISGVTLQLYAVTTDALATEQAQRTEVERLYRRSEGLRLAAYSTLVQESEPTQALLLALESKNRYSGSGTNEAILQATNRLHEKFTLQGHGVPVGDVAFSHDGKQLVSTPDPAVFDEGPHPAIVWDVASGKTIRELQDETTITSADFSPDRFRVLTASSPTHQWSKAAASKDLIAQPPGLWDATTGQKLLTFDDASLLKTHPSVFDADGRRVVFSSSENNAAIFDSVAGHALHVLSGHGGKVVFAAFSPQGDRVVTVAADNTVRIWNPDNGETLHELTLWRDRDPNADRILIDSVSFSGDGRQLVTGSRELGTHLWDVERGARVNDQYMRGDQSQFWPTAPQLLTYHRYGNELQVHLPGVDEALRSLKVSGGLVENVEFSPDGQWIGVHGHERVSRITLWNATNGQQQAELNGHESTVNALAFSPDSTLIASASSDQTVRLWHRLAGEQRATFSTDVWFNEPSAVTSADGQKIGVVSSKNESTVEIVGFDPTTTTSRPGSRVWMPDGTSTRYVLSRDDDLSIYSISDDTKLGSIQSPNGSFSRATVSLDGKQVAAVTQQGVLVFWFPDEQRQVYLDELLPGCSNLRFDQAGKYLAAAGRDGVVRMFEASTGRVVGLLPCDAGIVSLEYHPDGQSLIVGTDQDRAELFDLQTFEKAQTFREAGEKFNQAIFSFDGLKLLTFKSFGSESIQQWDMESGQLMESFEVGGLVQVVTSPIEHLALIASSEAGAVLWEYNESQSRVVTDSPMEQGQFSADGSEFFLSSFITIPRQPWQIIEPPAKKLRSSLSRWQTDGANELESVEFSSSRISEFWVSDSGQVFANTTRPATVVIHDVDSTNEISRIAGHLAPITDLTFTSDSDQLITASLDGSIAVWDAASGERLQRLVTHDSPVTSLAVAADDRFLISGDTRGNLILWDLDAGQSQFEFQVSEDRIDHLDLRPDGNQVACLTADGTVHLYDLILRRSIELSGEIKPAKWIEYSADGKSLLIVPGSATAKPTDRTAENNEAKSVDHHVLVISVDDLASNPIRVASGVNTAHFHPDGTKLLIATDDGTVALHDIAKDEVIQKFTGTGNKVIAASIDSEGEYVAAFSGTQLTLWKVDGALWYSLPVSLSLPTPSGRFDPFVSSRQLILTKRPLENQLRTWPLDPAAYAQKLAPRELTEQERRKFFIE